MNLKEGSDHKNEKSELQMKPFGKMSISEEIEQLIEDLGGFSRYQKYVFTLGCIGSFCAGIAAINIAFVGKRLDHRCLIPSCDNATDTTYTESFLNFTTPWNPRRSNWESCLRYETANDSIFEANPGVCSASYFQKGSNQTCSDVVFDTSVFSSTTVSEFNLSCDRAWLQPYGGSIYMVGMLFGSIILGDFGDRYGRRCGLLVAAILAVCSGYLCALSVNYTMFLVLRFIWGFANMGSFALSFVSVIEFVPAKYRSFCGVMIEVPFALGEAANAPFAFFTRDWRWTQALATSPNLVWIIVLICFFPESIRWLISQNKTEEARDLICKAAKMNKKVITNEMLQILERKPDDSLSIDTLEIDLLKIENCTVKERSVSCLSKESSGSALDLLKTPNLRKRTINLAFTWAVFTMSYYGLSANAVNLGGDVFVNFIAIILIEIPSYLCAYAFMNRFGRKGMLSFSLLLGGFGCIISGALVSNRNLQWLVIATSMIGKFGASVSFGIAFVYTAEMYSTDYRSTGVGFCSMVARLGSISAPFVADLARFYKPLPLLIFGVMSILSGISTILLPETVGIQLPQTLQESEALGSDQSIFYFECCRKQKDKEEDAILKTKF